MSESNALKSKILQTFEELKEYTDVVGKINQSRDEKIGKIREIFEKNKDADEIRDFAFDAFFLSSYQNLDLQIIKAQFTSYVDLYLTEYEESSLPEEIVASFKYLKNKLPQRMFVVKGGELEEIEAGSVEAKKQKFQEENLFKIVEQQLKAIMNVR